MNGFSLVRTLAIAGPLFASVPAFACTCAPTPAEGPGLKLNTVREVVAFENRKLTNTTIFEGVVEKQEVVTGSIGAPSSAMSMTPNAMHHVVTILVKRVYKGTAQGEVTVLTGMGTGDCGYDFRTGKEYLVFADTIEGGALFTSICSQTDLSDHSGPTIRFLRGEPPSADDLLDPKTYYAKVIPEWTGKACGRVTKPDGTPLAHADVQLTHFRDNHLPPIAFADPNLSSTDGSFCITDIDPDKYFLTAEALEDGASARWVGYYPGVSAVAQAGMVQLSAADDLKDLNFTVENQTLYTVTFRIVIADGSAPPSKYLGVAIDGSERDPLAYHETQNVEDDGSCSLGMIPPGRYSITTYLQPDPETGQVRPEMTKWRMVNEEVEITRDTQIVLSLVPAASASPH